MDPAWSQFKNSRKTPDIHHMLRVPLYLICKHTRKQNPIGKLGLLNCMVIVVTPTSCFWIANCLGNGARDNY